MDSGPIRFTALVNFGMIGIGATFLPPPGERLKPEATVLEVDFPIPQDLDDRQLADHIQSALRLPLTQAAPDWSLHRDQDNTLRFRLPTPGHFHSVTVLETANRLRITTQPFDRWQYLFHLHEMNPRPGQNDIRTRLWAYYGEFSLWALIVMSLSGLYLWLGQRGDSSGGLTSLS